MDDVTSIQLTPALIRHILLWHGWTYQALADRMDPPVDRSTVKRWLAGALPRPAHAAQLRNILAEMQAATPESLGMPSHAEAIVLWDEAEASAAMWRERAIDEGDEQGQRTAEAIIRLARVTRTNLAKPTQE